MQTQVFRTTNEFNKNQNKIIDQELKHGVKKEEKNKE
jgi:hypothetical protein